MFARFPILALLKSLISECLYFIADGAAGDAVRFPASDGAAGDEEPHLKDSLTSPIVAAEGHTAMLTCVVRNIGSHTLIWKYGEKILTAAGSRVTSDERINVIHDEGLKYI